MLKVMLTFYVMIILGPTTCVNLVRKRFIWSFKMQDCARHRQINIIYTVSDSIINEATLIEITSKFIRQL